MLGYFEYNPKYTMRSLLSSLISHTWHQLNQEYCKEYFRIICKNPYFKVSSSKYLTHDIRDK